MTHQHRVHIWRPDVGLTADEPGPASAEATVLDSWVADDGAVVGAAAHRERFTAGVRALFPDADTDQVTQFLTAVDAAIPRRSRWWPRIEAHRPDPTTTADPPELVLRLRPSPEPGAAVVLWTADPSLPGVEAPRHPRHKGPDQPLYSRLRELAAQHGATDAVLTDAEGHVLETDHSALTWWRGDTLCLPARGLPRLPSVTQEQVVVLAERRGVTVRQETVRADELGGLEIWTLNAAHGIRPVTGWVGPGAPTADIATGASARSSAAQWHRAWEESRADLLGR